MNDPDGSIEVDVVTAGPEALVRVRGELDITVHGQLRNHLTDCMDQGCTEIAIDLSQVTFIDSSGVALLAGVLRRLQSDGGHLVVLQPSTFARRVLDLSGLSGLLPIVETNDPTNL